MLLEFNLPQRLWGYAILHANCIKNQMHIHSLPDKTPFEMIHGKKLNLHDTYGWGKDVYIKIKQDDKLSHQATKVKWIGHSSQSDGHYVGCIYAYKPLVHAQYIFNSFNFFKFTQES